MKYPRLTNWRQARKFLQEHYGRWRLRGEVELWRDLAPILESSSSKGCTFHELRILYEHIVQKRPAWVLELGAGISTVVLGHAAKKVRAAGAPCTVVSMEENPTWYEELRKLLPESIADCVELILSPVADRAVNGFVARCYRDKPQHEYGMVFIDGPQVPGKKPGLFDGDILDVVAWNERAFTAYVDSRPTTRECIAQLFPYAGLSIDRQHRFARFEFPALRRDGRPAVDVAVDAPGKDADSDRSAVDAPDHQRHVAVMGPADSDRAARP